MFGVPVFLSRTRVGSTLTPSGDPGPCSQPPPLLTGTDSGGARDRERANEMRRQTRWAWGMVPAPHHAPSCVGLRPPSCCQPAGGVTGLGASGPCVGPVSEVTRSLGSVLLSEGHCLTLPQPLALPGGRHRIPRPVRPGWSSPGSACCAVWWHCPPRVVGSGEAWGAKQAPQNCRVLGTRCVALPSCRPLLHPPKPTPWRDGTWGMVPWAQGLS